MKSALERDNFMTADVAKSFGLIDEVVEKDLNTQYIDLEYSKLD